MNIYVKMEDFESSPTFLLFLKTIIDQKCLLLENENGTRILYVLQWFTTICSNNFLFSRALLYLLCPSKGRIYSRYIWATYTTYQLLHFPSSCCYSKLQDISAINDPLSQTQSLPSSDHYSHLKSCFVLGDLI